MKHFSNITASAERVVDAAEALVQRFGYNGFSGCGLYLYGGRLLFPEDKNRSVIDKIGPEMRHRLLS